MQSKIKTLAVAFALSVAACQTSQTPAAAAMTPDAETFLITSAANDFRAHVAATGVTFRNVHPGVTHSEGGRPPFNALCGEFRASGDAAEWRSFAILRMSDYEMWFGPNAYCRRAATVLEARDPSANLSQRYQAALGS